MTDPLKQALVQAVVDAAVALRKTAGADGRLPTRSEIRRLDAAVDALLAQEPPTGEDET